MICKKSDTRKCVSDFLLAAVLVLVVVLVLILIVVLVVVLILVLVLLIIHGVFPPSLFVAGFRRNSLSEKLRSQQLSPLFSRTVFPVFGQ